MSRFFKNTNNDDNSSTANGWGESSCYDHTRIVTIKDTVHGGLALQKMGTSIPHPFARLFVFNTAFNEVNTPRSDQYHTSYAKLVSECLDLIEFMYQYGDSITVKEWGQSDLHNLMNSNYGGHRRISKALEKAMQNLAFRTATDQVLPMQSVYLFYYQGALLGGSSPLTLLYTSPNISENLQRINANGFQGLNGNNLFQDYTLPTTQAVPLKDRSAEFQEFLMHYYFAYQSVLINTSIGSYIEMQCNGNNVWNQYMAQNSTVHEAMFDSVNGTYATFEYSPDGLNKTLVDILKGSASGVNLFIPLAYKNNTPIPNVDGMPGNANHNSNVSLDYEIRSDFELQGETLPLVLNPAGLPGAKLVNNLPQPEGLNLSTSEAVLDRILPTGQNIPYPYIYVDDLLEDRIVRLPYSVNEEGFISVGCGKEYFLIPVKPLFLKYFKAKKISDFLSISKQGDSYTLNINIPIKYRDQSIGLSKRIEAKDVINLADGAHNLGLAVFPSYRVINAGEDALNIYKVLVSDADCKVEAQFLKGYEERPSDDRIKELDDVINHFYDINGSFDAVRVTVKGVSGLVIPKFFDLRIGKGDIAVGVDFGTTNTYVCIKDGSTNTTLNIDNARPQVLTLNKPDLTKGNSSLEYETSMKPFGLDDFYFTFVRQFVPHIIGTCDAAASFPFRTMACETADYGSDAGSGKVLSDVSIGFNNMNETIDTQKYRYISNLKWLLDNSNADDVVTNEGRVRMFIEELAWLIKNSILLGRNPTKDFTVFTTYPGSMKYIDISTIEQFWIDAFTTLIPGGTVTVDSSIKESAAPFLYMLGTTGAVATNSVNVDIGGGTTDILYIDAIRKIMYADSSRFAGNDIWGDGIAKDISSPDNGFFRMIDGLITDGTLTLGTTEHDRYEQQKNREKASSSDIMSYIFQNGNVYTPTKFIRTVDTLKNVLFTHFSALCFHITRTLKAKDFDVRNLTVRFSGFGSKYIDIILPNDKLIASTMQAMFKAVGLEVGNLTVDRNPNVSPKEITAKGAVIAKSEKVRKKLEGFTNEDLLPNEIILNFGKTDAVTKQEMAQCQDTVITEYLDFIDNYLTKGSYYDFLRKNLNVRFSEGFIGALKKHETIVASFDSCAEYTEIEADDEVTETAFFWPFKEALYKASQVK